ncbi:MAG: spermidine synthase [Rhizobiaceae bacterium]|nr:spermidine synthase [Rhizobiaceae bacterium]
MIPWVHLDSAPIPGGGELRLKRRGDEFSIMLGANELMNSRLSGSEEALARLSIAKLNGPKAPQVLIGGLGMGFTLRAALKALGPDARITVAELVPEVVAWARGPMAPVFAGCLDDPRLSLLEDDVTAPILKAVSAWDAILLDVDNGPEGLSREANDSLYDARGLAQAHRALAKGGVLAVWSQGPDPRFTKRLKAAGFSVDEVKVRANAGKSGARHTIWLATK